MIAQRSYEQDGVVFDGALVTEGAEARAGVMVIHGWEGRSAGQERFAARLAALGYAAFCVDLYGDGRRGRTPAECEALMTPLMGDRALLRRRLLGALEAAAGQAEVDANRMAAIGFCFGGLCVLDLARADAPLKAVASFHGGLTSLPSSFPAAKAIGTKIAVYHGWDDPLAPPGDVVALAMELSQAKADWQLHAYGATMHAFMAEGVNAPAQGLQYSERSARRAWRSLEGLLEEAFGG
jgi:dienelactone hydrolase